MKDHSQHGEQQIVLDFFDGKPTGRFLDIGAYDGFNGSNTRALADQSWLGLLIEASPRIFAKLVINCRGNSNLICVNAAVMARCGFTQFHDIEEQCGTCQLVHQPANVVKDSFWLNATCPEMIADQFGDTYQFVSLDIEGSDLEVLKRMGPVLGKTELLCIEDAVPYHEFEQDYYDQMLAAAAVHGLSRVVARTNGGQGKGNTLLARP